MSRTQKVARPDSRHQCAGEVRSLQRCRDRQFVVPEIAGDIRRKESHLANRPGTKPVARALLYPKQVRQLSNAVEAARFLARCSGAAVHGAAFEL